MDIADADEVAKLTRKNNSTLRYLASPAFSAAIIDGDGFQRKPRQAVWVWQSDTHKVSIECLPLRWMKGALVARVFLTGQKCLRLGNDARLRLASGCEQLAFSCFDYRRKGYEGFSLFEDERATVLKVEEAYKSMRSDIQECRTLGGIKTIAARQVGLAPRLDVCFRPPEFLLSLLASIEGKSDQVDGYLQELERRYGYCGYADIADQVIRYVGSRRRQ